MRVLSYSENPETVACTAIVLNDPPRPGKVYVLPVPVFGLPSLESGGEDAESFRRYLAELVNEWLRCGKKVMPIGAEARGPSQGLPGDEREWLYWLGPEHYSVPKRGPAKRKSWQPIDESDPAFDSWIWKVYVDYLYRFKPTVWPNSAGEVFAWYLSSAHRSPHPPPTAFPPSLSVENADSPAWLDAVLWFIYFLNCGHADLLDRCRFCKRFFVRARRKKSGQVYSRGGPNCGNCKGPDSKERSKDVRGKAKGRMLETAAKAWAGWKWSHRTPDRFAAVADRVNADCQKEIFITTGKDRIEPLWVKRNEDAIRGKFSREK
jgi:hypothetical protein